MLTLTEFLKKWAPQISAKQKDAFIQDAAQMLEAPENAIWLESVISHQDTRPIVGVRIGPYGFQLSPEDARKVGRDFYEVADGAEADAFLFQKLTSGGAPPAKAYALIAELRIWRGSRMNQPLASYTKQ